MPLIENPHGVFGGLRLPSVPLQKFTVFPDLPVELQLKIWKDAARNLPTRLVVLDHKIIALPALLHTCHNSRVAILKEYHLDFKSPYLNNHDQCLIFINYTHDFLLLEQTPNYPSAGPLGFAFNSGYNTFTGLDFTPGVYCTALTYQSWLLPVQNLAMHINEALPLLNTQVWGVDEKFWNQLGEWCPELKALVFIYNEQMRGSFESLVPIDCCSTWYPYYYFHTGLWAEQSEGRWEELEIGFMQFVD